MASEQSTVTYVLGQVCLILWRHSGRLARRVTLTIDGKPLPKPYLGMPAGPDQTAAFLARTETAIEPGRANLLITDADGKRLFQSSGISVRPLSDLVQAFESVDTCRELLGRILKHAPMALPGWSDQLTADVSGLLQHAAAADKPASALIEDCIGIVEGVYDGAIRGWALDRRSPLQTLAVDVYCDGKLLQTVVAQRFRPELQLLGDTGCYGFEISIEDGLSKTQPATYELLFAGSVHHLHGSPFQIAAGRLTRGTRPDRLHNTDQRGGHAERPEVREPAARFEAPPARPRTTNAAPCIAGPIAMIDFVEGRRVTGWALDRYDPRRSLTLEFAVDGVPAGTAVANQPRDDLDFLGDRICHGFQVILSKDALRTTRRRECRLSIRDKDSGKLLVDGYRFRYRPDTLAAERISFDRRLERIEQTLRQLREETPYLRQCAAYPIDDYEHWFETTQALAPLPPTPMADITPPRISVLVPVTARCTLHRFQRVLESLAAQTGLEHQFLIINRSQRDQAFEVLARPYVDGKCRMTWIEATEDASKAVLRTALQHAFGDHLLLLQPGESLATDALESLAGALGQSNAKLLYGDSDHIDPEGRHCDPELRPDFNPDLLLSTPYIGAFCVERRLLETLAVSLGEDEPEGVWQYELLLRASEVVEPVQWLHVARVLTHRTEPDPARAGDSQDLARWQTVLRQHIVRGALPAQAEIDEALYAANPKIAHRHSLFAARLRWHVPNPAPKVSIIIPTRDGLDLVRNCVCSVLQRTQYPNYEILLIDHDSSDPAVLRWFASVDGRQGIRVARYSGAFNWSAINNFAVTLADGEVLCFLNNDTEAINGDWLAEMVAHACRPEVGAVGAKLLYPDGTVQHAGVILGISGVADHPFVGLPADNAGYMLRASVTQNLSAVTGACLVCRREVFETVGGFDVANLSVTFNDVDFCLRLTEAGFRHVWTPHAKLYHAESKSRGRDNAPEKQARLQREIGYMRQRWGKQLDRDPHYNPAFELYADPYTALTCRPWRAIAEDRPEIRPRAAKAVPLPALSELFDAPSSLQHSGDPYAQPIPELEVEGYSPFFRLLLAIWQLRPADLQQLYPLTTESGRIGFLNWCAVHGSREYVALRELQPFWDHLAQPADLPATRWSGGISRLMLLVARNRPDLAPPFPLNSEQHQFALLSWFWIGGGYQEVGLAFEQIAPWQKAFLLSRDEKGISRLNYLILGTRPDLQAQFDLETVQSRESFKHWIENAAPREYPILELPGPPRARPIAPSRKERRPVAPFGVNLVGYAFAELGIGEDVRMAGRALHAAGVPFTVIDFPPGGDVRQQDQSIAEWVSDRPVYPVNIVCLTALEHLRWYAERGSSWCRDRYTIGYWPWELQDWPANWKHCFSLVDEVWVSSRHTLRAVASVSPVPVRHMPMAVALPEIRRTTRSRWNLPKNACLFVFSYDGNSGLARKNPIAIVRAFQTAFPPGDEAAGLVIKCMRQDHDAMDWRYIEEAARNDARIRIIDRILTKPEVLGLYQACDCFVSLHRAEGFGRGIAEALLLGLEVIATGYGGNVDFCEVAGARSVPYHLVPVGSGDYFEAEGQVWAEPDEFAAADLMRVVAKEVLERGKVKKRKVREPEWKAIFAPETIGATYRERLDELSASVTPRPATQIIRGPLASAARKARRA